MNPLKIKLVPVTAASLALIISTQAAVISTIDPVGGEQDGVEFDVITGAGVISMADMQSAINSAAPGFSGVFDSSDMTGATNGLLTDTDDTSFGVLASGGVLRNEATRGEVLSTSGVNHTWLLGGSTFTFDMGTTGSAGVTHFGFVMVGWLTGGNLTNEYTVTANFSDSSSASLNTDDAEAALAAGGPGNGDLDTWFGFQAPAGETITNVVLTRDVNTGNWGAFDDTAFVLVPVPEPSSTSLLGLGLAGLLLRRRR